ncbi:MAG: hypothetical protein Kow0020_08190 [Wenzhouxiangellaceae bacterium]
MEVIIEQLGTTGNVLDRHKLDRHQVWLGRAYHADVILADEHVDPVHARLEFDDEGRLFIVDCDSVNGLRRERDKSQVSRAEVRSGDVYRMGRSRIRVLLPDHPVPPAVPIRGAERFLLWLGKPQVAIALLLLYLGTLTLTTWLATIGEFKWSTVIEINHQTTLAYVLLAVFVYLVSVLFRRGGNLLAHLSLLMLLFLFSALLSGLIALVRFNAGSAHFELIEWIDYIAGFVELGIYFWSILYIAFHMPLVRRTVVSLLLVALFVVLDQFNPGRKIMELIEGESIPRNRTFLPPALLLREGLDEAGFEQRFDQVFEAVEKARQEFIEERNRKNRTAEGS